MQNTGDCYIYSSGKNGTFNISTIACIILDQMKLKKLKLLKVSIQNFENRILLGAAETIVKL
jgi:hypothetical protein